MSKKTSKDPVPTLTSEEIADKVNAEVTPNVVDDTAKAKVEQGKDTKKAVVRKSVPKQVFETKQAAAIPTSTHVTPAGRAMMALPASGNPVGNGMSADRSGFNAQGNADRPDTRFGKKTNSTARSIRNIISEQFESEYNTAVPLNKSKDSPQGANGQPHNPHYHSQKVHGTTPLAFDFERSIDFITRDELLFVQGQYVNASGIDFGDGFGVNASGVVVAHGVTPAASVARGSYVPKTLTITIDTANAVTLAVDSDVITSTVADRTVLDRASQHAQTSINRLELQRQIMESKAGYDDAEFFSPLPLAVQNPVAILGMLKDIDASTGAELYVASKKVEMALSFLMNRSAKDGLNDRILAELFLGYGIPRNHSERFVAAHWSDATGFALGSGAWILALSDTLQKYQYKSDAILQPRGIRMLLETIQKNLAPFYIPKDFADLFVNREMFSTIGETYDAFKPIYMTDAEALVHSRNLSSFVTAGGLPASFVYTYNTMRIQEATASIVHPIIEGLYEYLTFNAPKIRFVHGTASNANLVIEVPIGHATTSLSVWDLLLCAASPEILRSRIASFRDLNEYTRNHGYPFDELVKVTDAYKMPFRNFSLVGIDEPLQARTMDSVHAITWVMPEVITQHPGLNIATKSASSPGTQIYGYLMPWYMSASAFDPDGTLAQDVFIMSMPNVRSGTISSTLASLHSVGERTLRLSLDMLVDIPRWDDVTYAYVDVREFKFDAKDVGLPFVTVRNQNASAYSPMTIASLLKAPRELGLSMVAPADYIRVNRITAAEDAAALEVFDRAALSSEYNGALSYVAWFYSIDGAACAAANELNVPSQGVAVGLKQEYVRCAVSSTGLADSLARGIPLSTSVYLGTAVNTPAIGDNTLIAPIWTPSTGISLPVHDRSARDVPATSGTGLRGGALQTVIAHFRFVSPALALWSRIQRLHFVISPWDAVPFWSVIDEEANAVTSGGNYKLGYLYNPYDYAGLFGLAGFSESDFSEDVYRRSSRRVVEGMGYTSDLFIEDTPLAK